MQQSMTIKDDGIALSAVLETPEGAEKGPLAIILHGFGSAKNRIHTLQAAEAMREAGFATLRFDLYGHGESGGEFAKHTLYKWISNTLAVIAHAKAAWSPLPSAASCRTGSAASSSGRRPS